MRTLLVVVLLVLTAAAAAAPAIIPAPPQVAATGYILQDFHSGQILTEQNADQRMEPASLTKIMPTYVVFHELRAGNLRLEDKVRISEKAWRAPGSRMFVEVNSTVSVEELLKGIIVQSGNDASIALAEHLAGSEDAFASIMNEYARVLEMTGTHYVNSTGLPHPEHYTTPRDLAILASALIRDFPTYYQWYSIEKYTYNDISQSNRNRLLWRDKHVDGIKTGHTEAAGYCLAASALRDGMRLISVVMGTTSENTRERATQQLLNYGFRFFETQRLYGAEQQLIDVRVWQGMMGQLSLGFAEDLYITVPRGKADLVRTTLNYDKTIVAPARRGQVFGSARVTLEETPIAERPLVALQDIAAAGWWKRLVDTILQFFYSLFD